MQVFYVNVGGGEPTVRRDFWELLDYATAHHVGVKFSTNGSRITPETAARLASTDYVDVQISLDGATAEVNDRVRGRARTRPRCARWGTCATPGFAGFKVSVVVTRENVASSMSSRRSPTATARSCGSPGCGRRAGAPTCGTSCTRPPPSSARSTTGCVAHGEDVLTGDSFFHLAAFGEALPGPEPVRRRPRRLPDRPDRRRLRLPVRDPRGVPGGQRPRGRRLRLGLARRRSCSRGCAGRRSGGACASCAALRLAAAAAAWPRSSSPGLRSTGPTPSACSATASALLAARAGDRAAPRPAQDHSRARPPRGTATRARWR